MTEKKESKSTAWSGIIIALITAVIGPIVVILISRAIGRSETQPAITPSAVVTRMTDATTIRTVTRGTDPTAISPTGTSPSGVKPVITKIPAGTGSVATMPVGNWQRLDDLPRTVNAFAFDPQNSNVVYAATGDYSGSGSGVYKSEDAGLSWLDVAGNLPGVSVSTIAFEGEQSVLNALLVNGDLYATRDGATTWQRLSHVDLSIIIRHRIIHMTQNQSIFIIGGQTGLMRSDDGGLMWNAVQNGLPMNDRSESEVLSLAIGHHTAENVIYAGTAKRGVYKSEDAGLTWKAANKGMLDYAVYALAIQSDDARKVWAATSESHLFFSDDGAQTWKDVTDKLPKSVHGRSTIREITCDPAQPQVIYLLLDYQGLILSLNGGESWRALGKPTDIDEPRFTSLAISTSPNPMVLTSVEDNRGAWRYGAGKGAVIATAPALLANVTPGPVPSGKWHAVTDLPHNINVIHVDNRRVNLLYAIQGGTSQSPVWYASTDQGVTWKEMPDISAGKPIMAMSSGAQKAALYAVLGTGDFYSSPDDGATWQKYGLVTNVSVFEQHVFVNPNDNQIIFSIGIPGGIAQSTDEGLVWTPLSGGLPSDGKGEAYVMTLAFDPLNPNTLYVGTGGFIGQGHGVYKSIDNGSTWLPANRGMLDARITTLVVNPVHTATLYAGDDSGRLFKSVDGGATWADIATQLPPSPHGHPSVRILAIDPANPANVYVLLDKIGLLFSNDGGSSWKMFGVPGDSEQPTFIAGVVSFGEQPAVVVSISDKGVWRWGK